MIKLFPDSNSSILLVCMPWASVNCPSLSLGLIQAHLENTGLPTDVAYFNLLWAEQIGPDVYETIKSRNVLASDWVFAEHLGCPPGKKGYLSYLERRGAARQDLELWRWLRSQTELFIERCLDAIDWQRYKAVGFTTSLIQTVASLRLAYRIKQIYPDIQIVFGGANCEGEMGCALHQHFSQVDMVLSGEADASAVDLFGKLVRNQSPAGITGLCFRDDGHRSIHCNGLTNKAEMVDLRVSVGNNRSGLCGNPKSTVPFDLAENPIPSYDDYFHQLALYDLQESIDPFLVFETSRGCWWGQVTPCKFCALNTLAMDYRSKPVDRIVDEMAAMVDRYQVTRFATADNVLAQSLAFPLGEALSRSLPGLTISTDIRPEINRRDMQSLAKAGVVEVVAGLENLSTPVLKVMRKGTNRLLNIRFLRRCKEFGVHPLWNYLYGFPGESDNMYTNAVQMATALLFHLPAPDVAFALSMQRYSAYHCFPEENGIVLQGAIDDYAYIYGLDEEVRNHLAYYFKFDYTNHYDPERNGRIISDLVDQWRSAYFSGSARLEARRDRHGVSIIDTRQGLLKHYRLSPLESLVLRLCESPISVSRLKKVLRKKYSSAYLQLVGRVFPVMKGLESKMVVASESNRYVALPVPDDPATFWLKLRALKATLREDVAETMAGPM